MQLKGKIRRASEISIMGKVCDECVRMIVVGTAGTVIRKIHANSVDANGYSVLMNAAWNGHEECLKEL